MVALKRAGKADEASGEAVTTQTQERATGTFTTTFTQQYDNKSMTCGIDMPTI